MSSPLKIDPTEKFPHLPHSPIVEAVVDVRTLAQREWEEKALRAHFGPKLDSYAWLDSQQEIVHELKMEAGQPPRQHVKELGLKGVRFKSADALHIVQFNRDGFVFSRLQPYDKWEQLVGEAMRLWALHTEYAQPEEVHRLGLRFINRIPLPANDARFEDYIRPAPESPRGLDVPFRGFIHHDTLAVPEHRYAINVIRTVQVPADLQTESIALILDVDVFTTKPFEIRGKAIEKRFDEMRWLKNKVFFGSVTKKALETFQ